jgi:hypothetical protein
MEAIPSDPAAAAPGSSDAVRHLLRALTSLAPNFTAMDADEETAVREAQLKSDAEAREAMRAERAAQRRAARNQQQQPPPAASTPSGRLASYLHQRAAARAGGGEERQVPTTAARVVMGEAAAAWRADSGYGGARPVRWARGPASEARPFVQPASFGSASAARPASFGSASAARPTTSATSAAPAHPPGHLSGKLRDLGGRIVLAKEQRLAFIAQLSGAARAEEPPSSSFGATSLSGVPEPYPSGQGGRRRRPRSASPAAAGMNGRSDDMAALRREIFQQRRREASEAAAAARDEAAEEARRAAEAAEAAAEAARARPARVIVVLHDQPAAEAARWRRACGFGAEGSRNDLDRGSAGTSPGGAAVGGAAEPKAKAAPSPERAGPLRGQARAAGGAPILSRDGSMAAPQAALEGLEAAQRQGSAMLWVGRRARLQGAPQGRSGLRADGEGGHTAAVSLDALLALTDVVAGERDPEVMFVPAGRVGGMRAVLASRLERTAGAVPERSPLALPAADPARALDGIALTLAGRYGLRILPRPDLLPPITLIDLPPISAAAAPSAPARTAAISVPAAPAAPGALFRHNPPGPGGRRAINGPGGPEAPPTSASVTQTVRGILQRKHAARRQQREAAAEAAHAAAEGARTSAPAPAPPAAWVPSAAPLPRSRQR